MRRFLLLLPLVAACGTARPSEMKDGPSALLPAPEMRADDASVEKFAKWLDSMTAAEFDFSTVAVGLAIGRLATEFELEKKPVLDSVMKVYPSAKLPHTRIGLLRLGFDAEVEDDKAWQFVAQKAIDRKLDVVVRREAVCLLGLVRSDRARQLMRTFLADPDGEVRKHAARSLVQNGKRGWNDLKVLMKSRDVYARWGAAMALALWDPESIKPDAPFPTAELGPMLADWTAREDHPWVAQYVPVAAVKFSAQGGDALVKTLLAALARPGTGAEKASHLALQAVELAFQKKVQDPKNLAKIADVFVSCYVNPTKDGVQVPELGIIPWEAVLGILGVAASDPYAKFELLAAHPFFTDDKLLEYADALRKGAYKGDAPEDAKKTLRLEAVHIVATRGNPKAAEAIRTELKNGVGAPYATWFSYLLREIAPGKETAEFLKSIAADKKLPGETRAGTLAVYAIEAQEASFDLLRSSLQDADEAVRRRAAMVLGIAGYYLMKESDVQPLLAAALEREKVASARRQIEKAIALLRSAETDPKVRKERAEFFFKILGIKR